MGSEMLYQGGRKQEDIIKSNFTQTCSRFSHFLKERRALGQLDAFKTIASSQLQINGVKDKTAINSFPKIMEKERMSFELFPMKTSADECRELPQSKEENKNASTPSMTIFYGGRVLVFKELPEDKAREIMSLASRGTMTSNMQAQAQAQAQAQLNINEATTKLAQDGASHQGVSGLSDLPLARRVSLHRFMKKRKHRIATSAPYQLQNSSSLTSDHSQPLKYNTMKNLFEQQHLELKL